MAQTSTPGKHLLATLNELGTGPRQYLIVGGLLLVFCQLFTVLMGQDLNYDQLNYHLLLASDLVRGENLADFAVAQRQSWFNPVPSVPAYLIITSMPPRVAQALLALLSVPAPLVAYGVTRRLLRTADGAADLLIALFALFIGITSYVAVLVMATSLSEAWFPALVLGALWLLMPPVAPAQGATPPPMVGPGRTLAAGLLLGAAAGFKITNAPFAVGGAVALFVLLARRRTGLAQIGAYLLGGAAAGFATGGWWLLRTFKSYGDPFYPLFAQALGAPWAIQTPLPEEHFRPTHFTQLLTDPIAVALGRHDAVISTSLPIRDARPLVLIVSLLALAVLYGLRLARRERVSDARLVAVAMMLPAYLLWFVVFDIERYMAPGYLMAGTFAALAVQELAGLRLRARNVATALVFGLVLVTSHPIRSGRVPFTADWFDLVVPPAVARPDTLYALSGFGPMGWLATRRDALGANAELIRLGGNFPVEPQSRMGARLSAVIATHKGPIRSLELEGQDLIPADRYGLYGLVKTADCADLTSKAGVLESCVLIHRR